MDFIPFSNGARDGWVPLLSTIWSHLMNGGDHCLRVTYWLLTWSHRLRSQVNSHCDHKSKLGKWQSSCRHSLGWNDHWSFSADFRVFCEERRPCKPWNYCLWKKSGEDQLIWRISHYVLQIYLNSFSTAKYVFLSRSLYHICISSSPDGKLYEQ